MSSGRYDSMRYYALAGSYDSFFMNLKTPQQYVDFFYSLTTDLNLYQSLEDVRLAAMHLAIADSGSYGFHYERTVIPIFTVGIPDNIECKFKENRLYVSNGNKNNLKNLYKIDFPSNKIASSYGGYTVSVYFSRAEKKDVSELICVQVLHPGGSQKLIKLDKQSILDEQMKKEAEEKESEAQALKQRPQCVFL